MRWSNFFEGFDSLWDGENEGVEWDERRELIRADRATQSFRKLLVATSEGFAIDANIRGLDSPLHVMRIGANWIEGNSCAAQSRVIVPLGRVTAFYVERRCDCQRSQPSAFNHVTIGAVLREVERRRESVSVIHASGGVNGSMVAVWKDAVTVRSGNQAVTVAVESLVAVVVKRT